MYVLYVKRAFGFHRLGVFCTKEHALKSAYNLQALGKRSQIREKITNELIFEN